ncbi:hypothetical protein AVEN_44866-1 [Araneus ventricosus]|uniref:Uncharacterized protein n=1 Tax=Araneus ventricosus TaxID=182803 RepID=A0A4Y2K8U6_ARAVE|nr:hypothetical protein AVEN_44866-1 [Araneus ventricosus]
MNPIEVSELESSLGSDSQKGSCLGVNHYLQRSMMNSKIEEGYFTRVLSSRDKHRAYPFGTSSRIVFGFIGLSVRKKGCSSGEKEKGNFFVPENSLLGDDSL